MYSCVFSVSHNLELRKRMINRNRVNKGQRKLAETNSKRKQINPPKKKEQGIRENTESGRRQKSKEIKKEIKEQPQQSQREGERKR